MEIGSSIGKNHGSNATNAAYGNATIRRDKQERCRTL